MYQQMNQRYTPTNGIIWVQGVEGAKAYQLMPSSNAILLDSENEGIFYIKTSDTVGMCNLRVFKYEEIQNKPTQIDTSQFVTKAELDEIIANLKGGLKNEQSISATKSNYSNSKQHKTISE